MKVIVFSRPDGGLSVICPSEGARLIASCRLRGAACDYTPPVRADAVCRVWPSAEVTDVIWAESEDEFASRTAAKDVPFTAQDVRVMEEADIPSDRIFRDAWRNASGVISVSMPHAREIHMARLRVLRAPKLAALDVAYIRADEMGDGVAKAAIAAHKQALRDVTKDPAISSAKTPEQLAAVLPAALA